MRTFPSFANIQHLLHAGLGTEEHMKQRIPLLRAPWPTQPQRDHEGAQESLKVSNWEKPFSCKSNGPSSICTQLVSTEIGCLSIVSTVKLCTHKKFLSRKKITLVPSIEYFLGFLSRLLFPTHSFPHLVVVILYGEF